MLEIALPIAFGLFVLALLLNLYRLLRGPTLPDRALALDTMYINTIGLIVLLGQQALFRGRHADRVDRFREHRGGGQIHVARRHHRVGATL